MLPVKIEGEYDLKVTFTAHAGGAHKEAEVVLPVGSRTCLLILGGWEGDVYGLQLIDSQYANNNTTTRHAAALIAERLYTLSVAVRSQNELSSIQVSLDGTPLTSWQGKGTSLSIGPDAALPQPQRLGLLAQLSLLTFQSVQIRMISGKAAWSEGK
jgi:hypothetical protein